MREPSELKLAVVQNTLPTYRVPMFTNLLKHFASGSLLLHGVLSGNKHGKMASFEGPVEFNKIALSSLSPSIRLSGKIIKPVWSPALGRALKDIAPDVILTEGESGLFNNFTVCRYASNAGIPYVWWGLGQIPGAHPSGLRRLLNGPILKMIRGASGIACYSSYARDFYAALGAKSETCKVVGNAIDVDQVERDLEVFKANRLGLRDEEDIPSNAVVLLSVGSLEFSKRLDLVIKTLPEVATQLSRPVTYWIVGDGEAEKSLELQAKSLSVSDVSIRFFGRRTTDIARFFLAADVFVLPGLGGLALNHAMAHGTPVITGPADGTERDLLGDGTCGVYLSEMTEETLTKALTELCDRDDLPKIARRAQERIFNHNRIEHVTSRLSDLLCQVV